MSQTRIVIIVVILAFLAFDNSNAFYRPFPSLIEKTLNKVLTDQLNERFSTSRTTAKPTTAALTTTTTTESASITTKKDYQSFTFRPKTSLRPKIHHHLKRCTLNKFEDCTIEEWTKFMKHAIKHPKTMKNLLQ